MKMQFAVLGIFCIIASISYVSGQLKIPIQRKKSDLGPRIQRSRDKGLFGPNHGDALVNAYQYNHSMKNYADTQYMGDIVIGSQNAVFSVVFDTGSDILWVPSTGCYACHTSHQFNCAQSQTCHNTNSPDTREYGTGQVFGYNANDMVGLTIDSKVNYPFLLVQQDSGLDTFTGDGIMGLSNDNSQKNFVDLAFDSGLIDSKVFSFYMDNVPSPSFVTNGSYMTVGYIPKEHADNVIWVPTTDSSYWSTDVIGMMVNDENIEFSGDPDIGAVLFDSGTSYMLVADNAYTKFEAELLSKGCYGYSNLMCPCTTDSDYSKYPNLTYYTRGAKFTITSRHYLILPQQPFFQNILVCNVAVQNTYLPSGGSIMKQILGDSFLRSNFIGFSKTNQSMAINAEHMIRLSPIEYTYTFWTGVACSILMLLAIVIVSRRKIPDFEKENMLNARILQQQRYHYQLQ